MKNTFNIITLGCKVNQYESEAVEEIFQSRGYEKKPNNADIYVINTCTVTNMSDRKSRQMISRARRDNPEAVIAVMGCYSQVKPEEVAAIEGVDVVLGSRNKEEVVDLCENVLQNKKAIDKVLSFSETKTIEELEISNQEAMTRAYMKIQDGCNMYCSYCLIPYARGNIASRDMDSIKKEAKRLAQNGYKEIVLTGIHVASYGKDLRNGTSLIDVIEEVAKTDGIERIRLSSMEPRHITRDFLERMKATEKACDHFHLSLQSGSDEILKAMNRKYDTKIFKEKVDLIREVFPNAGLTTDIIVGFPTEAEEDFQKTIEACKKVGFDSAFTFKYAPRPKTVAATYPIIDDEIVQDRFQRLLDELYPMFNEKNAEYVGKTVEVLLESESKNNPEVLTGRTDTFKLVHVKAPKELIGEIVKVKITDHTSFTISGDLVN